MSVQGANGLNGASGVPAPASSALRNAGTNPLNFLRGTAKKTAPLPAQTTLENAHGVFNMPDTATLSEKTDMATRWAAMRTEKSEIPSEKSDAARVENDKNYDTTPTGNEKTDQRKQACSTAFSHIKDMPEYKNLSQEEKDKFKEYIVKQVKENAADNPKLSKEALQKEVGNAHEMNMINTLNDSVSKSVSVHTDDKDNTTIKPDVKATQETVKQFGNPELHTKDPEVKKRFDNYEKLSTQMDLKGKDITEDNALQHTVLMNLAGKTDTLPPETLELIKSIGKEMSEQKFNAVYTGLVSPKDEHKNQLEENKKYLKDGDEKPELNAKEKEKAKDKIVGEGKKYSAEEWKKLSPEDQDKALNESYDNTLKEGLVGEGKSYSEEDWNKFSSDDKKQLLENFKLDNRIHNNKKENSEKFKNDFRDKLPDDQKEKFDKMSPEDQDKFMKKMLGDELDTSDPKAQDKLENIDKEKMKQMFDQLPDLMQNAVNDRINGLNNQEAAAGKKQMDAMLQNFQNEAGLWNSAATGISQAADACSNMASLLGRMRQKMVDNATQRFAAADQAAAQRQQQIQAAQRGTGVGQ